MKKANIEEAREDRKQRETWGQRDKERERKLVWMKE